jgi:transposase
LAKGSDLIQSTIYKNYKDVAKRNDRVLYYDCTNYFFEISEEDELRKYGVNKEHRPNPIVQMGLFMDGDGLPLAFEITPGNTNEQTTLIPLEKRILSDFKHSKFIVCTDAGLSSYANRRFNDLQDRAFITTQSIKQLKGHLKTWALAEEGWKCAEDGKAFNLYEIDEEKHHDSIFYKDRWIKENGLTQRLVVTYSIKTRNYQRMIRERQIERARQLICKGEKRINGTSQNDCKRFIKRTALTKDGTEAQKYLFSIDETLLAEEMKYDGYYGVCTNLEDEAPAIVRVNKRRWGIEECFRIMKHEFKSRPVYVSLEDSIKAHFLTCFLALMVYRVLENKLNKQFTCTEIINTLREMNFKKMESEGFLPTYTRTNATDALHEAFGFRTDYQIVTNRQLKK